METLSKNATFGKELIKLGKAIEEERSKHITTLKSLIADAKQESIDLAEKVNNLGPRRLTKELLSVMPIGSIILDNASVWSAQYEDRGFIASRLSDQQYQQLAALKFPF